MTAPIRGRIDIVEPERGGDEPGIEARHMAADDADRQVVQFLDQPPRRIDGVARLDLPVFTAKRPLRHIARFILIGIYTGTRASSIAAASPYPEQGRSFIDLERGIFYRKPIGKRATKKRQTPAPVPPRCWPTCAAGLG